MKLLTDDLRLALDKVAFSKLLGVEPEASLFTVEEVERAVSDEYNAWNISIKGGFLFAGKDGASHSVV